MKAGFIDWTEHHLNFYVFQKRSGQYTLVDNSSSPVEGELDTEVLRSFPSSGGGNIYLSLPLNLLTLREHTFPFTDRDKINDTLPFELEGMLLGNIDDYSIDHMSIESFETGSRVLAVCMEKARLKQIIDLFTESGLEPKVVTSLDLRLSEGKSEVLLEQEISDINTRAEAAGKEIQEPSVDLRKNELSYMGDVVNFVGKLRLTAALVLVLMIVLTTASLFRLTTMKNEYKQLTDEIQTTYLQVFPEDKKIIDADRQLKGNINMLTKKKEALAGIPVLDVLQVLASNKDNSITLHEFNADGKNIIIKGTAESFENIESLESSMSADFQGVKVTDSKATADKKIIFTIVMQDKTS